MPSTSDSPATKAGNTLLQRMMNSDIPKTHFFRLLTIPHVAQPDLSSAITSQEDEDAMEMLPQSFAKEESQDPLNPLASPVWRPSGAWKWITGMGIRACKNVVTLSCDKKSSLYFGTGTIATEIKTESVQFLCKTWPLDANMKEFVTEVALHKCQMRALAGTYVPTVIGVFTGVGIANMLMELPHQAFWLQASTDMPDVLKKRCVEAFEKLHAAGILHGSPHLRHLLIGGDARVTIMNFERSRVLEPVSNAHISQAKADAAELRLEMRKVKYQLDYDDARVKEKEKWERYKARFEYSKREVLREAMDPPSYVPPVLEVLEEDVLDPPIDTRRVKSWAPERSYSSARFVVPTITPEAFASAVEKFIANIRRLEREGDGPPPSRSPSPDPPPMQSFRDQSLVDQDPKPSSPEKTPAPRRSSRKRRNAPDDADSPPKRRKTFIICPPLPITPAATMESAASPLPKSITVESFVGSSPTISNHDAGVYF
ncbi:hypothetical protein EST38_g7618 [Candolleomyces aberdarensis]|uniref:Protein kinase domain-containing protein n=1 Tax=Candolleomyces aberdarensis TaxID=2316362 RepID=A0A4Q2DEQ4_9AGAR|nr:hypothetical protein EST38_g7618 [Candolleomyces aberdarensis]